MNKAGIDTVRIVWAESYENLCVEPSADCPGYVRVLAKDKEAQEFWGRVDFTMPKEMALALAAAKACDEQSFLVISRGMGFCAGAEACRDAILTNGDTQ